MNTANTQEREDVNTQTSNKTTELYSPMVSTNGTISKVQETMAVVSDRARQAEEKAYEMKDKTISAIKHMCEAHSDAINENEKISNEHTIEELQAALTPGMRTHRMPEKEVMRVQEKIISHLNEQRELQAQQLKEPYIPLSARIVTSSSVRYKDPLFFAKSKATTVTATCVGGAVGFGAALLATRRFSKIVQVFSIYSLTLYGGLKSYHLNFRREMNNLNANRSAYLM